MEFYRKKKIIAYQVGKSEYFKNFFFFFFDNNSNLIIWKDNSPDVMLPIVVFIFALSLFLSLKSTLQHYIIFFVYKFIVCIDDNRYSFKLCKYTFKQS